MLWVEILNRGSEWLATATAPAGENPARAGQGRMWDRRAHEELRQDLEVLRWVFAGRALGTRVPPAIEASLEAWTGAIRLSNGQPEPWQGCGLPALRASRSRSSLPREAEMLLSTALVQLLSSPNMTGVSRCHGAVRQAAEANPWGDELDAAFRAAAHLDRRPNDGWRQCPRLVEGQRGGRYCSKACSNAAFAARKGARDPRYFAAKQAQYRKRQRRAAARVDDTAVLFVD